MPKNPLVGEVLVDLPRVEDLLMWEIEPRYCRDACDLPAGTYRVGDIVANETPATASSASGLSPSYSDVICLENITVPDSETREVACLVRGPALVNLDAVTRLEDESDADLKTRLADLRSQGVVFRREPALQADTGRN